MRVRTEQLDLARHRLPTPRLRRLVHTALAAGLVAGVSAAAHGAMPAAASSRAGTDAPAHLLPSGARADGALPGTARLTVDIQLRPKDPNALARYATDVSTPGNTLYRQYLARGRFASEFGPTMRSVRTVERWLGSRGLAVQALSANHLTIQVSASAAVLDRALSVGLERVRLAGGRVAFANTRAPLLGDTVRPLVQGVIGLSDVAEPQRLGPASVATTREARIRQTSASAGPIPCATAASDASSWGAYTANEIASAYDLTGLYATGDEGAGITIGIFELETNLTSDIAQYQACYGTSTAVSYTPVDGGPGSYAPDGEADEDIEVVLGLAPKAHLDVYQGPPSTTGYLDTYTAMVDQDTAKVISTSWGACEAQTPTSLMNAEGTLFEQAAVQGQSIFAASGDQGSSACSTGSLAVNDPASQPYVTGVGGTTLEAIGPPPTEVAWDESATSSGAGGGGISALHAMPSYQAAAAAGLHVLNANSSGQPCGAATGGYCREVPDVSADSDWSSGYVVYHDGAWEDSAGTSAAAPVWAAFAALADASTTCGGKPVGFVNPALYRAAATSYAADFHDITSGSNADNNWGNPSPLYPAGAGYDMATGLGTPDGAHLAATLCSEGTVSAERTTTSLQLGRATVTYGREGAETFTVHVTGKPGGGQPEGTIVVFSYAKKLCSHVTSASTSDGSTARCALSAASLRAGRHPLIYAVFDPAVRSTSNSKVRYLSSESKPAVLTVVAKKRA